MKLVGFLSQFCFSVAATNPTSKTTTSSSAAAVAPSTTTVSIIKKRLSTTFADLFKDHQEPQESIDAVSHSPYRSLILGTIYGHRRGHVSFCVQHDPTVPPPFLFEFSMPTQHLARAMSTGLLRIALECSRDDFALHRWTVYINGHKVGYALKRQPAEKDYLVLEMVRLMSAGAGVLFDDEEEGELIYLRASYERVVGSRDSVSYHLVNPGGSPEPEMSIFLVRPN